MCCTCLMFPDLLNCLQEAVSAVHVVLLHPPLPYPTLLVRSAPPHPPPPYRRWGGAVRLPHVPHLCPTLGPRGEADENRASIPILERSWNDECPEVPLTVLALLRLESTR